MKSSDTGKSSHIQWWVILISWVFAWFSMNMYMMFSEIFNNMKEDEMCLSVIDQQLISSCLCTSHARVKSTRGGVVILCLCMMWPWWRSYITCEPPGLFEIFHRNHYGWDSSKKCKFLWNIYSSWEQTATIWGYLVHTLSEKIYKTRNCYSFWKCDFLVFTIFWNLIHTNYLFCLVFQFWVCCAWFFIFILLFRLEEWCIHCIICM